MIKKHGDQGRWVGTEAEEWIRAKQNDTYEKLIKIIQNKCFILLISVFIG